MTSSTKATIKDRSPELFGRGIDRLLFGDEGPAVDADTRRSAGLRDPEAPREEAYLDVTDTQPAMPEDDAAHLAQAAEEFLQAGSQPDYSSQPIAAPTNGAPMAANGSAAAGQGAMPRPGGGSFAVGVPAAAAPAAQPLVAYPAAPSGGRKVGAPPAGGDSGDDSGLSSDVPTRPDTIYSKQDAREILRRLRPADVKALDQEIDALYAKAATLLSGNRKEATTAFEILRKARVMLLKDPELYADAEYLVRQVAARMNQIDQSITGGKANAARLFVFQTAWMLPLALLALVTTVGSVTFTNWLGRFLGIASDPDRMNWAVLLLSTLAWGGIGGVTSALWSLYHHVSVMRDYDPVENLWYYSQPVLGMVLGGIVFLILGAGFLIVQVDVGSTDAAMGTRLLPAVVAVIAGFRQTMVLDLIERVIALLTPARNEAQVESEAALQNPPVEPTI